MRNAEVCLDVAAFGAGDFAPRLPPSSRPYDLFYFKFISFYVEIENTNAFQAIVAGPRASLVDNSDPRKATRNSVSLTESIIKYRDVGFDNVLVGPLHDYHSRRCRDRRCRIRTTDSLVAEEDGRRRLGTDRAGCRSTWSILRIRRWRAS